MAKPKFTQSQRVNLRKTGFARLSPDQTVAAGGKSRKSRWYATRSGEFITENEYRKRREGMSKAKKTRALATGAAKYRTPQAQAAAAFNRRTTPLRKQISGLTPADARLIDDYRLKGWHGLTPAQQHSWLGDRGADGGWHGGLFDRYPAEDVREALGYVEQRKAA